MCLQCLRRVGGVGGTWRLFLRMFPCRFVSLKVLLERGDPKVEPPYSGFLSPSNPSRPPPRPFSNSKTEATRSSPTLLFCHANAGTHFFGKGCQCSPCRCCRMAQEYWPSHTKFRACHQETSGECGALRWTGLVKWGLSETFPESWQLMRSLLLIIGDMVRVKACDFRLHDSGTTQFFQKKPDHVTLARNSFGGGSHRGVPCWVPVVLLGRIRICSGCIVCVEMVEEGAAHAWMHAGAKRLGLLGQAQLQESDVGRLSLESTLERLVLVIDRLDCAWLCACPKA